MGAALLRYVLFASPTPLGDMSALVFGDHALKLHEQAILRRSSRRRFQKDQFHTATGQFLAQQT
jgi:hypothetical protein